MSFLALRAYLKLIQFDCYLSRGNFSALYAKVRHYPISKDRASSPDIERLSAAMDTACIWYWKHVLCLQRSAATVCFLKQQGISAQLVLGAQQTPFKAHAWVEVEGRVIGDKDYVAEVFHVLARS